MMLFAARALLAASLCLLLHVPRSLLQSAADIGHLPVVVFTRELVELTGEALGLLLQVLRAHLIASVARAALLLGSSLHQFLLAFRQLLQFLKRFVDGLRSLVHLPALQSFILVFVLIEFEFEKVREVFGTLPRSPAASATSLRNLNFIEQSFGSHQVLKGFLFEWFGILS